MPLVPQNTVQGFLWKKFECTCRISSVMMCDTSTLTNPILQTPPNPCNLSQVWKDPGNNAIASESLKDILSDYLESVKFLYI